METCWDTVTRDGELISPYDLAFGSKNQYFYVADFYNGRIQRYSVNSGGNQTGVTVLNMTARTGTFRGFYDGVLNNPGSVFVYKNDNIFVCETYRPHRVLKLSPNGTLTTVIEPKDSVTVCGGNGKGDNLNQLNRPWSVFVDSNEKQIYVGDGLNGRVVRWSIGAKKGEIVVGGNQSSNKQSELSRVGGIGFDADGNLYVTDFDEGEIKKFLIDN
ncbi:unnamed protein product [Rotaria sp. Silwood2]|nr:unnamed protein product [Rotaria sp. Silwood2]CAF4235414.1 unnamed protein product [Rotaria sp. Silwood2]